MGMFGIPGPGFLHAEESADVTGRYVHLPCGKRLLRRPATVFRVNGRYNRSAGVHRTQVSVSIKRRDFFSVYISSV